MNEITKPLEKQAQDYANKVMSMNRHERRAFAKLRGTDKIYGSNIPIVNKDKQKN